MAECSSKRRKSRISRTASTESADETNIMGKSVKERKIKKPKERWLLTRKTWRYMADAGRKLIPDGAYNRPEDIPKIEAYFQEVCRKESGFLLWRKNSYPGALGFRPSKKRIKDRRKGGSCRKANSEDDIERLKPARPRDLALTAISGGRFDIQKMKRDFLNKPSPTASSAATSIKSTPPILETPEEETAEKELVDIIEKYLYIASKDKAPTSSSSMTDLNYQELVDKLQRHLTLASKSYSQPYIPHPKREPVYFEGDHVQKSLAETLSRYFSQYPNRDKVISDLLTDRKALEKLYFELRKTKGFRGARGTGYTKQSVPWSTSSGAGFNWNRSGGHHQAGSPSSVPPLIEIQNATPAIRFTDWGIQTDIIPEILLLQLVDEYKKILAEREDEARDSLPASQRRRSSVDNDDVSQSVSDTIKRYLRMARKKSGDSNKNDRFKRVNYDRNLRNIKAKGEITKPGDDDGLNKGCQTSDDWIISFKNSEPVSRAPSSRNSIDVGVIDHDKPTSPSFLTSSQSFLSHLLHGKHSHDKQSSHDKPGAHDKQSLSSAAPAGAMQKSKSSSSVMHQGGRLMAKKIFRSRSKSQSRAPAQSSWTPQGGCVWNSVNGRQVVLGDTTLLQLSEIERKVLQKVALAKLQALNLGVSVKIPTEMVSAVPQKPKRRAYLLKRKALTTGFFDAGRKDGEKEKDSTSPTGGLVFGIPLSQCVENDRLSRASTGTNSYRDRKLSGVDEPNLGRHGSRASFSSLIDAAQEDERGSRESLLLKDRRLMGSVPGLLDSLSSASTPDITAVIREEEPIVPHLVSACLRHLEANGLHTLGLFRVSPSKKRVRQLREDFDSGKETALGEDQCPHDVATLLKEYLRDLPDPLLCRDLYQAFIQTQRIRNRRLQFEALQHLVQLLPSINRDTLWALLNFLTTVAKCSSDKICSSGESLLGNKMDSNNLATVFAPNILHCTKPGSKDTTERPEDRIDIISVIRTLIDHAKQFFSIPAELLDEVYVHMMDTHPEILDQLLNTKGVVSPGGDESLDDFDSESTSAPLTPTIPTAHMTIDQLIPTDSDGGNTPPEPKRTWSREEFLHESAATGGPNVGMRIRHKDRERFRDRSTKKRRDDSTTRRRRDDDPSGQTVAILSRMRSQKDDDGSQFSKLRSSSIDSNSSVHNNGIVRTNDDLQGIDRRKSSPYVLDHRGVITASLTIPVNPGNQPLSLNLEHNDIPYIEDGGYTYTLESGRQPGRSPEVPARRRQRSGSGSDSSGVYAAQPITGSISLVHGYDSAIGSSATISSPPFHTAPSSVSSSIAEASTHSSPPSWASTPPTSPDSTHVSVNYIPDEIQLKSATKQKPTGPNPPSKDPPTLQKVSFSTTPEVQQIRPQPKQADVASNPKKLETQRSQSSSAKADVIRSLEHKINPSISSIGNAVLRSRTADFERIAKTEAKNKGGTGSEKKKYTKRRYTDSRHQTRHIPDAETLEASARKDSITSTTNAAQALPVYKRRELISSVPAK